MNYSKCWLPKLQDKNWVDKVSKVDFLKKIYISKNNLFLKKEIIFFIGKKNINFVKNKINATLIFEYNNLLLNEEFSINYWNKKLYINSKNNHGFIYGWFYLINKIQSNDINLIIKEKSFYIKEKPDTKIRMLINLDHTNGSIDKGYSGSSIFFFNNKIHFNLLRIKYYARLISSIGINSLCINSNKVNWSDTHLITKFWLIQLYEIYDIYIKYNIKLFISVNYKSPVILSNLSTYNPQNNKVIQWWEKKIEEIYEYMPYFGGLLIDLKYINKKKYIIQYSKLIASPLKYFNGLLFLKCSAYKKKSWKYISDKACFVYEKFNYLDGLFLDNVILQIKNGPIGYQVREPVSSLLGTIKKTSQILELQITQEYTGHQIDLCWLLPQWKYILNFDTFCSGNNSKIKKLISGKIYNMKYYGISGISNIGDNLNWTGNELAQANIFGYGKLLWNLNINLNNLLKEWIKLTFNKFNKFLIKNISKIMFNSWKTYEKYTSPLGIGGMVNSISKYGPNIDSNEYSNSGIYHYSNRYSLGVNRTKKGSKYTEQYFYKNKIMFNNKYKCTEELLLFFHHLPYTFFLKKSKKTIIQYIYDNHFQAVNTIIKWIILWKKIKKLISNKKYKNIKSRLIKQYFNARKWRDQINTYFFRKSGIKDKYNRKIYP